LVIVSEISVSGSETYLVEGHVTPKFCQWAHGGTTQISKRRKFLSLECNSMPTAAMSFSWASSNSEFKCTFIYILGQNKARHNIFYSNNKN